MTSTQKILFTAILLGLFTGPIHAGNSPRPFPHPERIRYDEQCLTFPDISFAEYREAQASVAFPGYLEKISSDAIARTQTTAHPSTLN